MSYWLSLLPFGIFSFFSGFDIHSKHYIKSQHTVKKMLQTTSCFLVVLFFAVNSQQHKQILYSRLLNEVTDYSLAVLYGEGLRFSHCAELCCEDDFCAEFLYSETNRQCFGLHYANKRRYSYQYMVLASSQMLHFKRGIL